LELVVCVEFKISERQYGAVPLLQDC
jgi:hypothetical protein